MEEKMFSKKQFKLKIWVRKDIELPRVIRTDTTIYNPGCLVWPTNVKAPSPEHFFSGAKYEDAENTLNVFFVHVPIEFIPNRQAINEWAHLKNEVASKGVLKSYDEDDERNHALRPFNLHWQKQERVHTYKRQCRTPETIKIEKDEEDF